MNEHDLNLLKQFALMTLDYLAEGNEYEVTALWQHLENERQLRKRLNTLYPVIDTILHYETK